jgi:hypothetical protein
MTGILFPFSNVFKLIGIDDNLHRCYLPHSIPLTLAQASSLVLPKIWVCVKSHFFYYQSPPEARMASGQNDFLDFLRIFTQPQISPERTRLLSSHSSGQGKSGGD